MSILWGGATASSQYDGNIVNRTLDTQDCRKYHERTSNATTETRLLTKEQLNKARISLNNKEYPFRDAMKGYENIEQDLLLLKELGIQIYRFSISWSFLFPKNNEEPNPKALKFYDRIFMFLKENNIKSFVTLIHYAYPIRYIDEFGGWKSRKMVLEFKKYSEFILDRWGLDIDYILPINEINAGYFSPYNGLGILRDLDKGYEYQDVFQGLHHQFISSAYVKKYIVQNQLPIEVVAMISCFCYYPLTSKPEDNYKLIMEEQINQWFCMDVLSKGYYPYYMDRFFEEHDVVLQTHKNDEELLKRYTCDIVSFSYYSSSIISTEETDQTAGNLVVTTKNPYLKRTDWGWQIDPVGLKTTFHKLYDRYQKPILLSENGMGAYDHVEDGQIHDSYRIEYLQEHFHQTLQAVEEGVPVVAYLVWGIIDIVSAGSCERSKRYGVIYVDADNEGEGTYNRIKKDSFYWYQRFISQNRK